MTPSPEKIGKGIVNVEAENQLNSFKFEINKIFKNVLIEANALGNAVITGVIAEQITSETTGTIDYFHPTVELSDPHVVFGPNPLENFVTGGRDFKQFFPFDECSSALDENCNIDWGGETGVKIYDISLLEEGDNPFFDFIVRYHPLGFTLPKNEEIRTFIDLRPLEDEYRETGRENEAENLEVGNVADYLLPKTIDATKKIKYAQIILTGLKNAGDLK